jgi:hypothetical protein
MPSLRAVLLDHTSGDQGVILGLGHKEGSFFLPYAVKGAPDLNQHFPRLLVLLWAINFNRGHGSGLLSPPQF